MTVKLKEELKEIYNRHASDREAADKQPWKIKGREDFLRYLKERSVQTILDVGAGTGQDSLFFKEEGYEVTAIDLSAEHIKYCRRKGINALEMDLYDLSFPAESFDALYSLNCLLHIPKNDLDEVLTELKRVLKKQGLFYLGIYGGREFEGKNEQDSYPEKRFFSFSPYDIYLGKLEEYFRVISAERISLEKAFEFHYFILEKVSA